MLKALLLLFILIPLAELGIFMSLGSQIGLGPTIAIIIITGFLGAALTKTQGAKALAKFRASMAQGQLPHREIIDGVLILLAGAVLLTPGFLTDTIGFALLVPPIRQTLRGVLAHYLASRVKVSFNGPPAQSPDAAGPELKTPKTRVIDV
ncbi:MAG: FxsA family protein [Verrucomicrobiota bacterium JB023]|nr:FxsA family protein [Verrucomicrobiota bacterium JB023]